MILANWVALIGRFAVVVALINAIVLAKSLAFFSAEFCTDLATILIERFAKPFVMLSRVFKWLQTYFREYEFRDKNG